MIAEKLLFQITCSLPSTSCLLKLPIVNAKMFVLAKLYPESRFTQLVAEAKEVRSSHSETDQNLTHFRGLISRKLANNDNNRNNNNLT